MSTVPVLRSTPPELAGRPGGPPAETAHGGCAGLANDERIVLMGLLIETHAKLTRVLGGELEAAVGIPLTWYSVLVRIARSDEQRLTMSQLGSEVVLTSGGITRLVDRMADEGLVERQHCPSDRRSIYVALTANGHEMLERATLEHIQGIDRHLVGPLDTDDRTALERILRKLHGDGSICGG